MRTRHAPLSAGRTMDRLRRRLQGVLDAGQRQHLADRRFYQLLSDDDRDSRGCDQGAPAAGRLRRLARPR